MLLLLFIFLLRDASSGFASLFKMAKTILYKLTAKEARDKIAADVSGRSVRLRCRAEEGFARR